MRPRIPSPYALGEIALRGSAAMLSVVTLGFLLYISTRFHENLGIGYASAAWVILWNSIEIAALSDRKRAVPRLPPAALAFVEFLTMVLCLVASVLMGLQQMGDADTSRIYAVYVQGAVAILHTIFLVVNCVDSCRLTIDGP